MRKDILSMPERSENYAENGGIAVRKGECKIKMKKMKKSIDIGEKY